MDVRDVRLHIVAERERQGLNQRELAVKADIDQGHMSKIENVDGLEMKDLAARVLFQVIEQGLGLPLSSFFAGIEQRHVSGSEIAVPIRRGAATSADPLPSVEEEMRMLVDIAVQLARLAEALEKQATSITKLAHARGQTPRARPRASGRRTVRRKTG